MKTFSITSITGGGGALANEPYVTVSATGNLTSERVLTGTTNQITITDNGAGSTVVVSTPQDIATSSSPTFANVIHTSGSGGTTDGEVWNDSTQKVLTSYTNGIKQFAVGTLYATYATKNVNNTNAETTLISSSGVGTLTLPANFFVTGKTIRYKAMGYWSITNTHTIRLKIKLGSTIINDTGTLTAGVTTNQGILFEGIIQCDSTGSSGTVFGQAFLAYKFDGSATGLAAFVGNAALTPNTSATTINTTTSQAFDFTVTFGSTAVADTITITDFVLYENA